MHNVVRVKYNGEVVNVTESAFDWICGRGDVDTGVAVEIERFPVMNCCDFEDKVEYK